MQVEDFTKAQLQPTPERTSSIRIVKDVPWKRSYRVGDVLELPMVTARGLIARGFAEKLSNMERKKHGLLVEDNSGHRQLEADKSGKRHYERTARLLPIKIVRNNGKAGSFDVGTISEMPFHEAMRLVDDGWAEHLTKAERDQHGFK